MNKSKLEEEIKKSFERAQQCWDKTGDYFRMHEMAKAYNNRADDAVSKIPGYDDLGWTQYDKGSFICLFADMRDSSLRFCQALKGWTPAEKRVLYETFSMQAMFEHIVHENGGTVTEFLGDGCLALFHLPDDMKADDKGQKYKDAFRASKEIVGQGLTILNGCLGEIKIPDLKLGVGLACSKAIITKVGSKRNNSQKAIGAGIYKASKLSCGENVVIPDKSFTDFYPKSKGGTLSWTPVTLPGFQKYKDFIFPMSFSEK